MYMYIHICIYTHIHMCVYIYIYIWYILVYILCTVCSEQFRKKEGNRDLLSLSLGRIERGAASGGKGRQQEAAMASASRLPLTAMSILWRPGMNNLLFTPGLHSIAPLQRGHRWKIWLVQNKIHSILIRPETLSRRGPEKLRALTFLIFSRNLHKVSSSYHLWFECCY